jgi:hypothetical protein
VPDQQQQLGRDLLGWVWQQQQYLPSSSSSSLWALALSWLAAQLQPREGLGRLAWGV